MEITISRFENFDGFSESIGVIMRISEEIELVLGYYGEYETDAETIDYYYPYIDVVIRDNVEDSYRVGIGIPRSLLMDGRTDLRVEEEKKMVVRQLVSDYPELSDYFQRILEAW